MAGYTRQDTANDIANGKVIDADVFDAEYNAVEAAFNNTSGHSHDGSSGEGAPITKVGPAQDLVVSSVAVLPKTTNTLDLGSSLVQFKDAYFDGDVNTDTLTVDQTSTFVGNVTASADVSIGGNLTVTGDATISGNLTFGDAATDTVSFTADVDSSIMPETNSAYDLGSLAQKWRNAYFSGGVSASTIAASSTVTATGGLVGNLTGNVTGNVVGYLTGQVSDISNHSTTELSEGTNLYYTDARARNAISASGGLSYDSSTGVISYSQGSTDTVIEGTTNLYYTDARVQTYISGNRTYGGVTTTGNVIVGGNLTVQGTTTTVNTETINLADNIILLNSNENSIPSQNSGIEVERGTSLNKSLLWDEANDRWTVGNETFVAATFLGNLSGNVTGNVTGTVSSLSNHDTGDLAEGSNLYYTNARADARIAAASITDLSDADQTVRTTDSPTFATLNASFVSLGDWTVTEAGGVLFFATGGVNKMKLDASGNLTVTGNVTAYGTV